MGSTTISTTKAFVLVDARALVSTSTYPMITGTANVPKVGVVISRSNDVDVVGSFEIPVVTGHWTYYVPAPLVPATYKLRLFGGATTTSAALVIK